MGAFIYTLLIFVNIVYHYTGFSNSYWYSCSSQLKQFFKLLYESVKIFLFFFLLNLLKLCGFDL